MRCGWILACLMAVPLSTVAADEKKETRRIAVTGTAAVMTAPDAVIWDITTADHDKNLVAAKEKSDAKLKAILGLREALGVKLEDVHTGIEDRTPFADG